MHVCTHTHVQITPTPNSNKYPLNLGFYTPFPNKQNPDGEMGQRKVPGKPENIFLCPKQGKGSKE